jgi:hypothetical protein
MHISTLAFLAVLLVGCQTVQVFPKTDPGGEAVNHTRGAELPQDVRPNDATISLYQDKRIEFIDRRRTEGRLYTVKPKEAGSSLRFTPNLNSAALERELSDGYLLSYLFYEDGIVKYDGQAKEGRFVQDVNNRMLFYTHSTGKSITSYIIGHAICEGYIDSIDERIDWPLMSETLYQGQPLIDLLNMRAGDKHTIDEEKSHYVMGSITHHRDMGLDTIAELLVGTEKRGRQLFYNNFLTDVIANYIVYRAGENYDELMRMVFQDKVNIAFPVSYEKHRQTLINNEPSEYYGDLQTLASYSYFMTRLDFLRVAEAMMLDYQNDTCVGRYLKEIQERAEPWYHGRNYGPKARLWINNYAQRYGGNFYFNFIGMSDRNVFGTEGYNGQNMLIDMDNSRIVITNSAATAWDTKALMLDVIRDGSLPE